MTPFSLLQMEPEQKQKNQIHCAQRNYVEGMTIMKTSFMSFISIM